MSRCDYCIQNPLMRKYGITIITIAAIVLWIISWHPLDELRSTEHVITAHSKSEAGYHKIAKLTSSIPGKTTLCLKTTGENLEVWFRIHRSLGYFGAIAFVDHTMTYSEYLMDQVIKGHLKLYFTSFYNERIVVNRCVREAMTEYIAYLDDDEFLIVHRDCDCSQIVYPWVLPSFSKTESLLDGFHEGRRKQSMTHHECTKSIFKKSSFIDFGTHYQVVTGQTCHSDCSPFNVSEGHCHSKASDSGGLVLHLCRSGLRNLWRRLTMHQHLVKSESDLWLTSSSGRINWILGYGNLKSYKEYHPLS